MMTVFQVQISHTFTPHHCTARSPVLPCLYHSLSNPMRQILPFFPQLPQLHSSFSPVLRSVQALPLSHQGKAFSCNVITPICSRVRTQLTDQKRESSQFTDTGTLTSTKFNWEFQSIPCTHMQCISTLAAKRRIEFFHLQSPKTIKEISPVPSAYLLIILPLLETSAPLVSSVQFSFWQVQHWYVYQF